MKLALILGILVFIAGMVYYWVTEFSHFNEHHYTALAAISLTITAAGVCVFWAVIGGGVVFIAQRFLH
jgi:hypothetical protein